MQYEVEQKHWVDEGWDVAIRLSEYGAQLGESTVQVDQYFAHPCRDFAETDEALRIRTQSDRSFVTYKGPKIDKKSKTRLELEIPLNSGVGEPEQFADLLQALGFMPVATVRKNRRTFRIHYSGRDIEGAYDRVDQVGVFIELELKSDKEDLENTKRVVAELAAKLELGPSITRSYLEMLLDEGNLRPAK